MLLNILSTIYAFFYDLAIKLVPILVLVALTLLSFWFLKKNIKEDLVPLPRLKEHTPDYVFFNAKLTVLNKAGQTKYRLLGTEFKHYEDDASIDIIKPRLKVFNPKGPPLTVQSDTAHVTGELDIVELFNHAIVYRPADINSSGLTISPYAKLTSNYMQFFINDDILKTNVPVQIERGLSVMSASQGAIYNNVDQSVSMFGDVHGYIEASDMKKSTP
jgi:lipopolysaccharide export system protein LptC